MKKEWNKKSVFSSGSIGIEIGILLAWNTDQSYSSKIDRIREIKFRINKIEILINYR